MQDITTVLSMSVGSKLAIVCNELSMYFKVCQNAQGHERTERICFNFAWEARGVDPPHQSFPQCSKLGQAEAVFHDSPSKLRVVTRGQHWPV